MLRKLANGSIVPDVNGGVPQRANLTLHRQLLQAQVVKWLPDADYSGNAVFGELLKHCWLHRKISAS